MAKYTFEEIVNMDVFDQITVMGSMTSEERKEAVANIIKPVFNNGRLQEATERNRLNKDTSNK